MIKVVWSRTQYKGAVKTKTITQDITAMISSLTWSGASTQASRQVSFSIIHDPYDKNINPPNIAPGDTIRLYKDKEKKPRFIGRVPNRQMTSDVGTIEIIAYDYMHNMISSTMTKKFKKKTPEYITKAVLKDVGITAGSIVRTGIQINKFYPDQMSPYDIIVAAYRKAAAKTKKKYYLRMNGNKLDVIEKGEKVSTILEEKVNLTNSNYEENADGVVNKVDVYKNNKRVGSYKNDASIRKYGVLQQSISVDSGKGKTEAKNTMKGVEKTASISVLGDWSCTAGKGVYIKDTASGLIGWYWIKNDTHTFSDGVHLMELDLEFKNVMENVSIQELQEQTKKTSKSSKSSSSDSSSTVTYKKKKAKFSAYYPGENGEWTDGQDHRLVESKRTCAATRSIPFGTKLIIKKTGSKYDGRTYKVTDRPAVKYDKVDGKIHIDVLVKDEAETDAFGWKDGEIWIIKKKKKKSKRDKKIDKVIKEAKKWIGKLSYSQSNRQNFHNGGSADCSSFTHHCFKKIGIEIGSTTDDQPRVGKHVSKNKRKRGDLVFFHTCKDRGQPYGATHVGICLSKKKFIHCSSSRNGVVITRFSSYTPPIVQVRRVL